MQTLQASNFPRPKLIIFDWDQTLVNTLPIIYKSLNATFRDMGYAPVTEELFHKKLAYSLRDSFPQIFGDDWQKARDLYYQHFLRVHLQELTILEGAQDILEKARKSNIYCAILSNKTGNYLRKEVTHLGWQNYFTSIIGAQDCQEDKPSTLGVLTILQALPIKMPLNKENVWFIGDSVVDMRCAVNATCRSIFLHHKPFHEVHIEAECVPDHWCKDWAEFNLLF